MSRRRGVFTVCAGAQEQAQGLDSWLWRLWLLDMDMGKAPSFAVDRRALRGWLLLAGSVPLRCVIAGMDVILF
jgi:hypothetical protein